MNERYFILKRGAFVNDGKKLQKRDEPISRKLLELENEIETLETLLKMTQIEYERYRTLESPEISKKRAAKIYKKALLVNMLLYVMAMAIFLVKPLSQFSLIELLGSIKDVYAGLLIFGIGSTGFIFWMYKEMINNIDREFIIKEGLEKKIEYLEQELETATTKLNCLKAQNLQDPEMQESVSLEEYNREFLARQTKRANIVGTLEGFKAEVLKHAKRGTLESFLRERGIVLESKEEKDFVAKRIAMLPKK